MLPMPAGFGALTGRHIVAAQQMEQGSLAQFHGAIGLSVLVNQERKFDPGLFPKKTRVGHTTQPDCRQFGPFVLKSLFVFAQLRDVFTAEDSAVVAKEDKNGRTFGPQRAEPDALTVSIWKSDSGKLAAERFSHAEHSPGRCYRVSSY
jgi:hypothetical protein